MKYILYALTGWWLCSTTAAAQTALPADSACGFTLMQRYQRANDSLFARRMSQSELATQERLRHPDQSKAATTPYLVPVVVHVIHNGEAIGSTNNPSDAAIQTIITNLNNAFGKNGPNYGGVDVGIQFQLAVRSPQCGPTTGISRVDGRSIPNYTTGGIAIGTNAGSANEVDVKALSRWPNTDYMNIWIVNRINNTNYIGGFTYFPEYTSALNDGMTIIAATVTATNTTAVHEMGHYFNLYHTFHDESSQETACPSLTDCANTGDFVCDTEPVVNVPCNASQNPCTGAPFQVADASQGYTIQNNYMGYTSCQWMFTQQQKDRMRDALLAFRAGLLSSDALKAPAPGPVAANCRVTAANALSLYYGVGRMTLGDLDIYSNSAQADGDFYVDRTCNQRAMLMRGQTYVLTVQGAYNNTHYLRAYLDLNRDGDFSDAGETILTATGGSATATIGTSASGIVSNVPIRLRVVADNPSDGAPTACALMGNTTYGSGQVEDYTVVFTPRMVTSLASGDWNTAAIWSCNCVPTATDQVIVQAGHTITVGTGLVQASALTLAGRVQYSAGGRLKLTGN